jgi:purine nucleosidase
MGSIRDAGHECESAGRILYDNIVRIYKWRNLSSAGAGETYILGDQPLVTLTALQATFHPEPSSSTFITRPVPTINENGSYDDNPKGRPIRVYTHTDVRLTFDFFAKLALFAKAFSWLSSVSGPGL